MSENTARKTFAIGGMDCAACARAIEDDVIRLPGVTAASVDLMSGALRVEGDVPAETVAAAVRALGYGIDDAGHADEAPAGGPLGFLAYTWRRPMTRMALLGTPFVLPGLLFGEILGREAAWMGSSALVAAALAGAPVARAAWTAVKRRSIDVHVLMTLAGIGAIAIGAWVEAGMVMVLYSVGVAVEGFVGQRARSAIRSLGLQAPETAIRLRRTAAGAGEGAGEPTEAVRAEALAVGDVVLVRPGGRVPVDGRVVAGASTVDAAAITGESRPIEVDLGDEVLAGSINGAGTIELEVARPASDSTLRRVARLVESARQRRAPVERAVDRFSRWYTPAVAAAAAAVAVVPPLLFGLPLLDPPGDGRGWLYRGLALLVVACPCALVLSTPASVAAAISGAARRGILFKGGDRLEALARVRAVAFDKTGTLTRGRPTVVDVRSADCLGDAGLGLGNDLAIGPGPLALCSACDDLVALAGAIEARSEHVLARAVVDASIERGLRDRYADVDGVRALAGLGVSGRVDGREVTVGSHRLFDQAIAHDRRACDAAVSDARRGSTPLLVSADGAYVGTITVADELRPEAREVVRELGELGLRPIAMLTGDGPDAAGRIATRAGVRPEAVRAGLMPADKLDVIAAMQRDSGPVAMIGDGVNDAPALAAADVGMAVGAGTDAALESADVGLMGDDLHQVPEAIRRARRAMRIVRQNIALSLGVKLAFAGLVLAGAGTLWMAVLADVGMAVVVTLNGLRAAQDP